MNETYKKGMEFLEEIYSFDPETLRNIKQLVFEFVTEVGMTGIQAVIFLLCDAGVTPKEISQRLGIHPVTIRNHYKKAVIKHNLALRNTKYDEKHKGGERK